MLIPEQRTALMGPEGSAVGPGQGGPPCPWSPPEGLPVLLGRVPSASGLVRVVSRMEQGLVQADTAGLGSLPVLGPQRGWQEQGPHHNTCEPVLGMCPELGVLLWKQRLQGKGPGGWSCPVPMAIAFLELVPDPIPIPVPGPGLHPPSPGPPPGGEEVVRGIAVEKFDIVKKWGINTYKVRGEGTPGWGDSSGPSWPPSHKQLLLEWFKRPTYALGAPPVCTSCSAPSSCCQSGLAGGPVQWTWSWRLRLSCCVRPSASTRACCTWHGHSRPISTASYRHSTPWGMPLLTSARNPLSYRCARARGALE